MRDILLIFIVLLLLLIIISTIGGSVKRRGVSSASMAPSPASVPQQFMFPGAPSMSYEMYKNTPKKPASKTAVSATPSSTKKSKFANYQQEGFYQDDDDDDGREGMEGMEEGYESESVATASPEESMYVEPFSNAGYANF